MACAMGCILSPLRGCRGSATKGEPARNVISTGGGKSVTTEHRRVRRSPKQKNRQRINVVILRRAFCAEGPLHSYPHPSHRREFSRNRIARADRTLPSDAFDLDSNFDREGQEPRYLN